MDMETQQKQLEGKSLLCETASEPSEIQRVMSIFDKEIQRLDENISLLTQKLDPVLMEERPTQVKEERPMRDCKLSEAIQSDIDAISRTSDLIDELRYRIAL